MRRPAARPPLRRRPVAATALLLVLACRSGSGSASAPPAPDGPPRVVLDSPSGRRASVTVEVARTPAELERGLMFRERLGPDAGMLFVFPRTAEYDFWMKNTLIPLDMIFADAGGNVVGIVENAEPLTTTSRSAGAPSRYVLEVNGGWSAAHGVARGDRMRFEGIATDP